MRYILIWAVVFLSSCQKEDFLSALSQSDNVDFYRISKDSESIFFANNSIHDKDLQDILLGDESRNLDNFPMLIKNLDKNYEKYEIAEKDVRKISGIFSSETSNLETASFVSTTLLCAPVYRDVLVFRNKDRIIGIAKICFNCSQNIIKVENVSFLNVPVDFVKLQQALDKFASS